MTDPPTIAILGASGLIGMATATWLSQDGLPVVPIARRFTRTQKAAFGLASVECPITTLDVAALTQLFASHKIEIVVNCIGVLQDGPRDSTELIHCAFVDRLVKAVAMTGSLLVHLSIPGSSDHDETRFSQTKRHAERIIGASTTSYVILRPGFVIAPAAYGGSALMRALAVLPFSFPKNLAERPLSATDVTDIARTIAFVAGRWHAQQRNLNVVWDTLDHPSSTLGDVLDAFRYHLGGPKGTVRLPSWLMKIGARTGDVAGLFGWRPPIRSTALRELRRGVTGEPGSWIAATGIQPTPLGCALRQLPITVQERWFAYLYLAKPLVIASLAVFWVVSGLIALTVAFGAATTILTTHGIPLVPAKLVTAVSSGAYIVIGAAIAVRRSCRSGLIAGISLSLFYMFGGAILAPDLWIEPLGALVKTAPAIVLMLIALAIVDDR